MNDISVQRDGTLVLDIDRLRIDAGRITAVVGANGAGKTTLLELASLLRAPTRGRVHLWGRPAVVGDSKLRRDVVMMMHPGYLFAGTVWANVVYGLRARGIRRHEATSRGAAALDRVRLGNLAKRDARTLSAGERQRLNLARVIVLSPKAVLLDEPTANVDTETLEIIRRLLGKLRDDSGTTIVHTSPGVDSLGDITDRIITLAAGRVRHTSDA